MAFDLCLSRMWAETKQEVCVGEEEGTWLEAAGITMGINILTLLIFTLCQPVAPPAG